MYEESYFFYGATAPVGQDLFIIEDSRSHSVLGKTHLDERSARRIDLYLTIHSTHKRQKIYYPGGIRIQNSSKRAATEPRLRPRGRWERLKTGFNLVKWNQISVCEDGIYLKIASVQMVQTAYHIDSQYEPSFVRCTS
jgi:hypothetical protein